jgi:hypothetical protein
LFNDGIKVGDAVDGFDVGSEEGDKEGSSVVGRFDTDGFSDCSFEGF